MRSFSTARRPGVETSSRRSSPRVSFSLAVSRGEGVQEQDLDVSSCAEIGRLWQAIEKSVQVIKGARERAAMHQVAA